MADIGEDQREVTFPVRDVPDTVPAERPKESPAVPIKEPVPV